MAYGRFIVLLRFILDIGYIVLAYPNGAPNGACNDMIPKHGSKAQDTVAPYKIALGGHEYSKLTKIKGMEFYD